MDDVLLDSIDRLDQFSFSRETLTLTRRIVTYRGSDLLFRIVGYFHLSYFDSAYGLAKIQGDLKRITLHVQPTQLHSYFWRPSRPIYFRHN